MVRSFRQFAGGLPLGKVIVGENEIDLPPSWTVMERVPLVPLLVKEAVTD